LNYTRIFASCFISIPNSAAFFKDYFNFFQKSLSRRPETASSSRKQSPPPRARTLILSFLPSKQFRRPSVSTILYAFSGFS